MLMSITKLYILHVLCLTSKNTWKCVRRYVYKLPPVISLFPAKFSTARQVLSLLATAESDLSYSILAKVAMVFS